MAKHFFEVTCCSSGYHYWQVTSRLAAERKQEELLATGRHTSIIIYDVTRRAISMKQPKPQAGRVCLKQMGLYCSYDHDHVNQ